VGFEELKSLNKKPKQKKKPFDKKKRRRTKPNQEKKQKKQTDKRLRYIPPA